MPPRLRFDEIGIWSEIKLEIIKEYAAAYSRILAVQTNPRFEHVYVDAFAGAGLHVSRTTGKLVQGSPLNALAIDPPFAEYHLIDINAAKAGHLRELTRNNPRVTVHDGDCNRILLDKVFPRISFRKYRRGLCILDPYGLHLDWIVIDTAAKMRTVELFLNFPVADMNRNVLWQDPEGVDSVDLERMSRFWGDDSWRDAAYRTTPTLFGPEEEKTGNEAVAEAFRQRLLSVAGFARVPKPMPMRNSRGAIVYYLFFASQKDTAEKIVLDIFAKYQNRGGM